MHVTHGRIRSEEHTSELQSRLHLVCRLLLEKKNMPTNAAAARNLFPGTIGWRKRSRNYPSQFKHSTACRRSASSTSLGRRPVWNTRFNACGKNARAEASSGFSKH